MEEFTPEQGKPLPENIKQHFDGYVSSYGNDMKIHILSALEEGFFIAQSQPISPVDKKLIADGYDPQSVKENSPKFYKELVGAEKREELSEEWIVQKIYDTTDAKDGAYDVAQQIMQIISQERENAKKEIKLTEQIANDFDDLWKEALNEITTLKQTIADRDKQVAGFLIMLANRDKDDLIYIPPPEPTT